MRIQRVNLHPRVAHGLTGKKVKDIIIMLYYKGYNSVGNTWWKIEKEGANPGLGIGDWFIKEVIAFGILLVCDLWYKYAQMLACAFRDSSWMNLLGRAKPNIGRFD